MTGGRMDKKQTATLLEAAGVLLTSIGAAVWSVPAGFVVAGVGAVLFGVALERD